MTKLTKPITRKLTLLLDHRLQPRDIDQYAVTLYPDAIGFRQYKRRKELRLPLASVLAMAIRAELAQEKKAKR